MAKHALPELPAHLGWYSVNGQRFFPLISESGSITPTVLGVILDRNRPVSPQFKGDFGREGLHREIDGYRIAPTTSEREKEIRAAMERDVIGVWYVVEFSGFDTPEYVAEKIQNGIDAMTLVATPELALQ